MATTLTSNYVNRLASGFLKAWNSQMVFSKTVNRSVITDNDFRNPASGDTAFVRRPWDFTAVETARGDLTSSTMNTLQRGRASAVAQNVITVPIQWDLIDESQDLNDEDLGMIMSAASSRLATKFETNLAAYAKNNLGHTLGTVTNTVSQWSDVAQIGSFASAMGFPEGRCTGLFDPYSIERLANAQNGLAGNSGTLVTSAWERAAIAGNFGNVDARMCDTLAAHTTGAGYDNATVVIDGVAPTQTYLAAKDTYQTTLALTGFANGDTLLIGDRLSIPSIYFVNQKTKTLSVGRDGAPLPYQCVVTATPTAADANGDMTVVVQGPAIFEANGQYDTISAAIGTSNGVSIISGAESTVNIPSIFMHPEALGLAFVRLSKLYGQESRVITSKDGSFSMRLSMGSDMTTAETTLRIDMQPVFSTFNPLLGGVVWGN
tara:strand:+ start:975 stop:2273 length:1299 start_codon:yes stop_codon:yes gene_type:complete